jgi:glycerophosphoryl diester phosphodiesterase
MSTFAVVAKAGGAGEGPENTCAAIAAALAVRPAPGTRVAVEVDVRLSADNRVVVIHDALLERTTNGRGLVRAEPLERLRRLEAGPGGERIPTLEDVLDLVGERELVVEAHDSSQRMAQALADSLRRAARPRRRVIVASEHGNVIEAVRALEPSLSTAATVRAAWSGLLLTRLHLDRWLPRGAPWMLPETHRGLRVVTPRFARAAARAGDELWVYVVDQAAEALRLRGVGATGVFTTTPAALSAELSRDWSREPAAERGTVAADSRDRTLSP